MLHSMTGYGAAQLEAEGVSFLVEVRSVNNRFLKTIVKLPDALAFVEPPVTRRIQASLARGAVTMSVHLRYTGTETAYEINAGALGGYLNQVFEAAGAHGRATVDAAALLQLPGVCQPRQYTEEENAAWEAQLLPLVDEALAALRAMRAEEGRSLLADLQVQCEAMRGHLHAITALTGRVVDSYRERVQRRVNEMLAAAKMELDQDTLAREVAIFAERCDINEEAARLESHLDQFLDSCAGGEQVGRRLDFITQEMLREANTIASKANDAEISRHVVEIKVAIDRLKEQVQNIE